MNSEELKHRYKVLPLWGRLLAAAIIGILPGVYIFFTEGMDLYDTVDNLSAQAESAKARFEKARQQKANLPQLEEKLAFTEEQLQKVKALLPDSVPIEDILQKTATIAKDAGVQLLAFTPAKDEVKAEPYPYVEMPVLIKAQGRYVQVANFFDRLVHLDGSLAIRRLTIARKEAADSAEKKASKDESPLDPGDSTGGAKALTFQQAKEARQNLEVTTNFTLAVFRAASETERLAVAAVKGPGLGDGARPKAGKGPRGGDDQSKAPGGGKAAD